MAIKWPSYTAGGNMNCIATMKYSIEVPLKTKNRTITTIWSSNPTPGHVTAENSNSERYIHPHVHCSAISNSQDMESTNMSINRGVDKEDVVHIHIGLSHACATSWSAACQAPLSMGFSRQEYWGGLSCPPPGELPDPGIKPVSPTSNLHWQVGYLPLVPPGKPIMGY